VAKNPDVINGFCCSARRDVVAASTTEDEIGSAKKDRRRKPSSAKIENSKSDSEGEKLFSNTVVSRYPDASG